MRAGRLEDRPSPLIVAMTGATGVIFGIRTLELLRDAGVPRHLIMTEWAARTIVAETGRRPQDVRALADIVYGEEDVDGLAAISSFATAGMIVAPCSMKSLAAIAHGVSDNLVQLAAALTLDTGRRLLLLVRESPLSVIHLENMLRVARAGAMVVPPVPAFYARPRDLDEMIDHTVGRMLDHFAIPQPRIHRWGDKRPTFQPAAHELEEH
jgi:flavin prenyltransferase